MAIQHIFVFVTIALSAVGCSRQPSAPAYDFYPTNEIERAYYWPDGTRQDCIIRLLNSRLSGSHGLDDIDGILSNMGWSCELDGDRQTCTYSFSYYDSAIHKVYDPIRIRYDIEIQSGIALGDFDQMISSVVLKNERNEVSENEYRIAISQGYADGRYSDESPPSFSDLAANCE